MISSEFDSPNFEHKMKLFPCYICLVRAMCKDYIKCDLLSKDRWDIKKFLLKGICPDCGSLTVIHLCEMGTYVTYKCNDCKHLFKQDHYNKNLAYRITK